MQTTLFFVCEHCGFEATPKKVQSLTGLCRKCNQSTWTLVVEYSQTETNMSSSALGMASLLVTGYGWTAETRHSNQRELRSLDLYQVLELTNDIGAFEEKVATLLREIDREQRKSSGAVTCSECDALFVPSADKSWTERGFCSASCAKQQGEAVSSEELFVQRGKSKVSNIEVTCPGNHTFEVMASFAGCIRPCPTCGEKCEVP